MSGERLSFDVMGVTRATDDLLTRTENPHHRAILLNFRRHALLEVSGRWPEILVPEMTVEEPRYRIAEGENMHVFDGMEAVRGFYKATADAGLTVFGPIEERIAVADWGFASESHFAHILPGRVAAEQGHEVDDPDAYYLSAWWISMAWHYTPEAKLIGEHVYGDPSSTTIRKLDPDEVVLPEQARELLAPLIEEMSVDA